MKDRSTDNTARYWLGVDTGGTFTDFVLFDGKSLTVHKRLSTPHAPEQAILSGIAELKLPLEQLRVVHGSTVATNAALEAKGVKTAYITNRGFGDTLAIGRQARDSLYDLQPEPRHSPVPSDLCFETGGRLASDGKIVEPLTPDELHMLRQQVASSGVAAVAINLLFSFLDDRYERAIESAMPPDVFISRSSAVLPEYKEYERGVATWLNAWIGPIAQQYLNRLQAGMGAASLTIMQSNGGTMSVEHAGQFAIHMLLSGPAGGLAAARHLAALISSSRLLTFDMGGTSTDVALFDGELRLTNEGHIGPYPLGVPMIDIHTIGAGGGSIASVDPGGLLHVGPESAGADPGPACYGRGGRQPTVTDANLILGRLPASAKLGGSLALHRDAAVAAIAGCAKGLALSIEETARGIVDLANEHMQQALRLISVQRGFDPRQFTLLCFGGAGGLHVCPLAEALDMRRALVPAHAGVLSALGMLAAPAVRHLSRTHACLLKHADVLQLNGLFDGLANEGSTALQAEGASAAKLTVRRRVDLRYLGQSYALSLDWDPNRDMSELFHSAHERRFGHRLALDVELVTLRAEVAGPRPEISLSADVVISARPEPIDHCRVHGYANNVPVYSRTAMGSESIVGPAIILDPIATTFIDAGWRGQLDAMANLVLEKATD